MATFDFGGRCRPPVFVVIKRHHEISLVTKRTHFDCIVADAADSEPAAFDGCHR